ncbi:aminopeptidase P family protein [Bacteroidales bacterium OttesenSCG-928-L03]|nr:aminopeptidase P family protein [Bacteroidales bacterium OttesenSCG-928-L03]
MNVIDRITALRQCMSAENIQACVVPSTDPHISEYVPAHWECREFISGFTGSAGTVVITGEKAGLWTDSRYFLQAEEQLKGSGIDLFKIGLAETPHYIDWICGQLAPGDRIGIEGEVFDLAEVSALKKTISGKKRLELHPYFAPWDSIWKDRPAIPEDKIFLLPHEFSGESVSEKISRLRKEVAQSGGNACILASLDQIAWLYNLRGTDIPYNPVAVAYAFVDEKQAILFINPKKITREIAEELSREGVVLADYDQLYPFVHSLGQDKSVVYSAAKINYKLHTELELRCPLIAVPFHPVDTLKAVKNETEIQGIRHAMKKDGAALVHFLYWLDRTLKEAEAEITEMTIAEKLREFRSQQPLYFSESFSTIAGYQEHGAIVHYEATEETASRIRPEGILLIDSGAQYFDGTTDITRTIALSDKVSPEQKRDYTNVLKGNIALSRAKFPQGTTGHQLDVLARQFLWQEKQNFLHGTGHGIGHFLCVHEGPQSIRMNPNPVQLLPGMVTSNEPGLYIAGQYGIRIENLLLTREEGTSLFGTFLAFETLTLCPIDTRLIDITLLAPEEVAWLNDYHEQVRRELQPLLSAEEVSFLNHLTSPL